MTPLAKAGSIVGGGIAGAGGVYGTYQLTKSSSITIKEQLIKENRVILDTEKDTDNTTWKTKFTPDSDKKAEKFTGWGNSANTDDLKIASLKAKCKEVLKEGFTSDKDQNYLNAKELCSREATIREILSKNKTILDATGTTSNNDWTTKVSNADESGKMKTFAEWGDDESNNDTKVTAIKKKCEEVLKKLFVSETNGDYLNAKEYCTK